MPAKRLLPDNRTLKRWVDSGMTHQEIANRLGCSREMVSRLLKDLEKGGYVFRRKDQTLLLKQPMPVAW